MATHVHDCAVGTMNNMPMYRCGGTYICPRCEREFGWCIGAWDDTPALCDECANLIQYEDDGESPILARTVGEAIRRSVGWRGVAE